MFFDIDATKYVANAENNYVLLNAITVQQRLC